MKKLVYLHELDSVRTSEKGIEHGVHCLFEEIVKNGNYVALSMNQLADSKIILSIIQNKADFDYILNLFEKGVIRVSRYVTSEEIRTPAQYMLNSLSKNIKSNKQMGDSFITSALPIKHTDKELMTIIHDAIKYSDPDSIRAKWKGESSELVEYFCTYVSFILEVSKMKLAGNPPKQKKAFLFSDFMEEFKNFDVDKWFADDGLDGIERKVKEIYNKVQNCRIGTDNMNILELAGKHATEMGIDNRSNWHSYFSAEESCKIAAQEDFGGLLTEEELLFSEMLIDLCYNYTVEESIEKISLHYENYNDKESLHEDMKQRIMQYWDEMQKGIYWPRTDESTEYIPCSGSEERTRWDTASRVIDNVVSEMEGKSYEADFEKEQKEWRGKVRSTIFKNIGIGIFYIGVFCGTDYLTGKIQETISTLLSEQISNSLLVSVAINLFLFTIIFSAINSMLSNVIRLPDVLESVKAIVFSFRDFGVVRRIKSLTYRRKM